MYKKNNDGSFSVVSRKKNDKAWTVKSDMSTCNCPKFRFITKGAPCHHIEEVRLGENAIGASRVTPDALNSGGHKTFERENFKELIKLSGGDPMKYTKFIAIYGEAQYNLLLKTFDVFYERRDDSVRLL